LGQLPAGLLRLLLPSGAQRHQDLLSMKYYMNSKEKNFKDFTE
jgi:hypothetical protein